MSHHTVGDEDEDNLQHGGKSSTAAQQSQHQNQHVGHGIISRKLQVKRIPRPNYCRTPLPTSVAST
jgi:hypothetical protein